MMFFFIVSFPFVAFCKFEGKGREENEWNKHEKGREKQKKDTNKKRKIKMKDKMKETQQRMINKGGMNKSILCQQRGYFLFCCPTTVLKRSGVVCAPKFLSRTSILSIRPRTFACICCPQFPYYPYNNETHSACFSNRRGAFLYFCFCFCLFCEHCSEKGGYRCKGGNPRRICVTVRLPVQLELCLAESAHNTKQQQRKKLPKGAMFNPRHAQSPAPNSRRSPKRGQKSATSPNRRENDRMSASTHETAARTQFFGAFLMSRTLSSSVLLQSMSPKTLLSVDI